MIEAAFYTKNNDNLVICNLCRHNCRIKDGKRGICNVRENKDGRLYSIFYSRPCAMAVDPIEKKPLFHFLPASKSFSIATFGCNFQCDFCQNWDISQYGRGSLTDLITYKQESIENRLEEVSPSEVLRRAIGATCKSISYTYSEPTIFYEYARDIAIIAKKVGLKNIFVTNGFMTRSVIDEASAWLDAANIDLKAFKKETYKKVIKADLNGVLDSIAHMKKLGIWIEITTLLVPKLNDDESEITDIANFIAGVGKEIPWHISRFHPQYKMQKVPITPIDKMVKAYEIGKKAGLKYVYLGNVSTRDAEDTFCWNCGKMLIERTGYNIGNNLIRNGRCPTCNSLIDGLF